MKIFHYFALVVCAVAFGCMRAEISQTGSSYEKLSNDQEGELYEYGSVSETLATPQGVPIVGSEQPGDMLVVHQEQGMPTHQEPVEQPVFEGQMLAQPQMVKPFEGQAEVVKPMVGQLPVDNKQASPKQSFGAFSTKEANQEEATAEQNTLQQPIQAMLQEENIPAVDTTPVATTPEDEQKIMKDMAEIK